MNYKKVFGYRRADNGQLVKKSFADKNPKIVVKEVLKKIKVK